MNRVFLHYSSQDVLCATMSKGSQDARKLALRACKLRQTYVEVSRGAFMSRKLDIQGARFRSRYLDLEVR